MELQYLVKILSGPHQGAEAALADGDEIEIGSSLECDLILSDALIAPNHLKLGISSGEITITPLADKVYLDGRAIGQSSKQINAFQYITIGTTHLVIGPGDQSWPALNPPSLDSLKELGDIPEAAPTPERTAAHPLPPRPEPAKNLEEQAKDFAKRLEEPKFLMKAAGGLCAALIVGVLVMLNWPSEAESMRLDEDDIELAKLEIYDALDGFGIDRKYVTITDKFGQLQIEGYAKDNKEAKEITLALRSMNPYYRAHFKTQENMVIAASEILSMQKAVVKVSASGVGILRVSGYFPDDKTWERAKRSLYVDLPGLTKIIDEVTTGLDIRERAKPIMKRYGLEKSIALSTLSKGVYAKGRLADNMRKVWTEAKFDLESAFGADVPFIDQVFLTPAAERLYLDAPVESITITENLSWMTLKNGKTFFEGSSIPSGYMVDAISRDGVMLRRGHERVTLRVGDQ